MRRLILTFGVIGLLGAALAVLMMIVPLASPTVPRPVYAQATACEARLEAAVAQALNLCGGAARGQMCWASGAVEYTPNEALSEPGGQAPLEMLTSVVTRPSQGDQRSIARLNFVDLYSEGGYASAFLIGPLMIAPAEATETPWTNLTLTPTDGDVPDSCDQVAPPPGLLIQAPAGQLLTVTLNGVSLTLNNTVYITAPEGERTVVNVLRGNVIAQLGESVQVAFAGYSLDIPNRAAEIAPPMPYDSAQVENLPTQLLPSIVIAPLPGNVQLLYASPLYAAPDAAAGQLTQLLAGTLLNLLGQNSSGQWWHVIQEDGLSGWVPADYISGIFPPDTPEYSATPQPPTRPYGAVLGRGQTPNNEINLRSSPTTETNDNILAKLPPFSEFSILGRNANGDWIQVRLDAPDPITGATEGWLAVRILTLPESLRIGDLPVVP